MYRSVARFCAGSQPINAVGRQPTLWLRLTRQRTHGRLPLVTVVFTLVGATEMRKLVTAVAALGPDQVMVSPAEE
jgi:hypothetical protein